MLPKRTPISGNTDELLTVVAQGRIPVRPASVPPPARPVRESALRSAYAAEIESEDDCEVTRMMPSRALDSVPPPSTRPLQTRVHLPRRERAIMAPPPPPPPPSGPAYDTLRPVAAPTADQIEAHMNVIRAERMMAPRSHVADMMMSPSLPPSTMVAGHTVIVERGRRSLTTWGVAVGAMAVFGALLVAVVTGGVGPMRAPQAAAAAAPMAAQVQTVPAPVQQVQAMVTPISRPAPMAYAAPATPVQAQVQAPVATPAPVAKVVAQPAKAAEPKAEPVHVAKAAAKPRAVAAPAPRPVEVPTPSAAVADSSDSDTLSAPSKSTKTAKATKGGKPDGEVASATAADEEARKLLQDSL